MTFKRYLPPIFASCLVVGIGPFVGQIRTAMRLAMSSQRFVSIVELSFAVVLGAFLLFAVLYIRRQRWLRYGGLALGLGLMVLQFLVWNRGIAETDAVERIHFVLYGAVAFLFYRAFRASYGNGWIFPSTLVAVTQVGTLDEWFQWFVAVRTGEVLDVVLNAYAGLCGLVVSVALDPPGKISWRWDPGASRSLAWLLACFLLVFGGFFHSAHLGYEIHDEEIGTFRSFFTRQELLRLREQKGDEWRNRRPGRFRPLEPEDRYLTESGWHVSHRNASYTREDYYPTWQENRILEKYYTPFLATRNRDGRLRRWPEAQIEKVRQGRPWPDPYPYMSPADSGRIFVVPTKGQFWSALSILVAALLVAPRVLQHLRAR